ncbi:MAG TPA: DUF2486 family protein [Telluria sp.]|nr:DUF2486 family protein [Telluria sp.]
MTNNAAFDASIPVLTEVFQDHPIAEEVKAVPEAPAPVADEAQSEARFVGDWTDAEWEQLERRLSERILHQLQSRVDFVLEQRLRDSMQEALEAAMAGLTGEIRRGLQQTIETIVARAVTQELAHLQTLKK